MQLSGNLFHHVIRGLQVFMDEQLLIDGCKRGEALARKELYELYAPAMMSVCVPVNLVINLWDNPDWNVYVSGGMIEKGVRFEF